MHVNRPAVRENRPLFSLYSAVVTLFGVGALLVLIGASSADGAELALIVGWWTIGVSLSILLLAATAHAIIWQLANPQAVAPDPRANVTDVGADASTSVD